jgi:hypothetical protein
MGVVSNGSGPTSSTAPRRERSARAAARTAAERGGDAARREQAIFALTVPILSFDAPE